MTPSGEVIDNTRYKCTVKVANYLKPWLQYSLRMNNPWTPLKQLNLCYINLTYRWDALYWNPIEISAELSTETTWITMAGSTLSSGIRDGEGEDWPSAIMSLSLHTHGCFRSSLRDRSTLYALYSHDVVGLHACIILTLAYIHISNIHKCMPTWIHRPLHICLTPCMCY